MLNENPVLEHSEVGCELQLESSGTIRCNGIATHNDAKLWQKQKTSFEQKGKLYRFVENVFGMMQFYAARSFFLYFPFRDIKWKTKKSNRKFNETQQMKIASRKVHRVHCNDEKLFLSRLSHHQTTNSHSNRIALGETAKRQLVGKSKF